MRPVPVVVVQPSWQMPSSLLGAVTAACIGPLTQARLDEALSLAVRSRCVGLDADVLQSEPSMRAVAGAIVCHDAFEADA